MPLIDLKTDLKSLKFGKDRPGGGSSNQPYIQKDIPEGDQSNLFNTGDSNSLLRGGLIAPLKAANDVSRLSQMLFDLKSPNGLLFTVKENTLSRTSVKTEASKGEGYGGGEVNQGIYLPSSTIAQAEVGFTGTHLNLLGIDPSGLSDAGLNDYFSVVKNQELEDNRLLKLTSNTDPVNVLTYSGGPGSVLGVGNTNIPFADQRTGDRNPQSVSNADYFYKGFRWNDRTTDSWIFPLTKGASDKYESYTESPGSLIFPDGTPIITTDGGYTYNQNWDYTTTKSGSLEARENVADGSYLNGGLKLSSVNYTSSVNGITNQILDSSITLENDGVPYYFKTTSGLFYNKVENTQLTKVTSIPVSVQTLDGAQEGGIRINYSNAISADGVSNLYNTLVEPISGSQLDNEYTNKNFFNVYDPNVTPGNTWPLNTSLQQANGSLTFNQREIIETNPVSQGGTEQDFRDKLTSELDSSTVTSKGYSANIYNSIKKDNRVNLGDAGSPSRNRLTYSTSTTALDKINASALYTATTPEHTGNKNDFIKFSIGIVDNDDTGNSTYMNFRAHLDSFNDQYSSDWGNSQFVGRADKFYNYKGFDRKISLSWTVYAQSKAELAPMYKKLNYLASSLSPSYSSAGFMQGNLARLTVGSYLYNQLGIINGITYDVPQESPWEIAINENGGSDESTREMPFMIKVTGFQFVPIQEFVPQRGSQFIVQHKKTGEWAFSE